MITDVPGWVVALEVFAILAVVPLIAIARAFLRKP